MREQAGLLIHHQRIVFPTVPAAQHDFHELIGSVIARIVFHMDLAAHVVRLAIVHRGDDIPGRAPAQHVVHGLESACHVEGFVVRGRGGGADAQVPRAEAHRQQRRDGIDLHHPHAIRNDLGRVAAVQVGHRQAVVEERHLELACLQHLADALVIGSGGEIRSRIGVPPGTRQCCAVLCLQKSDHHHLPHRHPFPSLSGPGLAGPPRSPCPNRPPRAGDTVAAMDTTGCRCALAASGSRG